MCKPIDSYPTKPTKAEKIGSCEICGERIFSDEHIWQSEKGDLYYCDKCVEESARKRFEREKLKRQARIEFIVKELIICMKHQISTQ